MCFVLSEGSYIFFVSFVQSPFKEALRDLSWSSDLSELAVPREKGSGRRIKNSRKTPSESDFF